MFQRISCGLSVFDAETKGFSLVSKGFHLFRRDSHLLQILERHKEGIIFDGNYFIEKNIKFDRKRDEKMKSSILLCTVFVLWGMCSGEAAAAQITTVNPHIGNTYEVGADGQKISLINYKNASDPTYTKLVEFIKADKTDERLYSSKYVCSDFAETVHNNAEATGIKAAWVSIDFKKGIGHACNAFNTTDKGLVFIDCTGSSHKSAGWDTTVKLTVGKKYKPNSLYSPIYTYSDMGTVRKYCIYW